MSEKVSLLTPLAGSDMRGNVAQLASDGMAVRESLGRLTAELGGRIRQAVDPVLRRRHPLSIIGVAGLAFVVVGGWSGSPCGTIADRQVPLRRSGAFAGPWRA